MGITKSLVSAAAILALVVGPVMAQMGPSSAPPPAPGAPAGGPGAPGGPGVSGAPGASPAEAMPREKQIEGPVKKVDPAAKTIKVGWFFGLFRTTLEVNGDTQVMAEGRKSSLVDIREGEKVKASYETTREGKNIAKAIEVLPSKAETKAGAPKQ